MIDMRSRAAWGVLVALAAAVVVVACSNGTEERTPPAAAAAAPPAADTAPAGARPRVVCLGDSLTAGYGLASPEEAYPALLEQRLAKAGLDYEVINAGVSGDTSAGGLRRLDWSLQGDVRVLIVALGGNDGLRGLPPSELHDNLAAIIEGARAAAHPRPAHGHGGAAQLRRSVHAGLSRRLRHAGPRGTTWR